MNKRYAFVIYKIHPLNNMTIIAWKCYRCDLTFTKESHAILHKDIENHSPTEIQISLG